MPPESIYTKKKSDYPSPDYLSDFINRHGGQPLCVGGVGEKAQACFLTWCITRTDDALFRILTYYVMFTYKYIYFSTQNNKNCICGTQCVVFKHLFYYPSILASATARVTTPDK